MVPSPSALNRQGVSAATTRSGTPGISPESTTLWLYSQVIESATPSLAASKRRDGEAACMEGIA
jgi:hypothetical protein